jgi:hypothetical protein
VCAPFLCAEISPASILRIRVGREIPSNAAAVVVVSSSGMALTVTACPRATA